MALFGGSKAPEMPAFMGKRSASSGGDAAEGSAKPTAKLDPEELKEQVQIFRITKPKVQKKSEDLDDWGEEGHCKILSLQTSLKLA